MDPISRRHRDPIFDAIPTPILLLDTDLVIKAVNRAYEDTVGLSADDVLLMQVFDAFPDNPEDPHADGVANLSASLDKVLTRRRPHDMLVQRYDVVDRRTGTWVSRVWQPTNSPVMDGDRVIGVVHQVQDITPVGEDLYRALTGYRDVVASTSAAGDGAHGQALAEHLHAVATRIRQHQALVEEVLHLRRALTSRATIDQAKGMIMADRRCSADEAFHVLRKLSSETNVRVVDVALALVYQAQGGGADLAVERS
ncbi:MULTISPECIES: ANTAR domain-containing protein [Nocardioides]|uniref:ANTAR domain-containing protein n=1 Tax=Nocardioides vastitatis TaxID=2568655 RepID=A0ABW0ZGG2_9ACTN|nr:ANTAR domain-containing protein [Nocardioides sp.]